MERSPAGYQAERNAFLAAIVESSDDAIISKDLNGRITSWNGGAQRLLGYSADEIVGRNVRLLIPGDRVAEEPEILNRISRGERLKHFETVRLRKDGSIVDVSLTVSPIFGADNTIVGASKILRDITERKIAEATQQRLTAEIDHRVKNTLATVQSMAEQTLRMARDPQHFVQSFRGRIQALARAHHLLTSQKWSGVDLRELINDQVSFGDQTLSRLTLTGPDVEVNARIAVHLGLVLHELATNARYHGALKTACGTIDIGWGIVQTANGRCLTLHWKESGGPTILEPLNKHLGMRLIELGAHHALGGEAHFMVAGGANWRLELPLDRN